jgi:F0F1-type ATP synthase membrane subunit b/b'
MVIISIILLLILVIALMLFSFYIKKKCRKYLKTRPQEVKKCIKQS